VFSDQLYGKKRNVSCVLVQTIGPDVCRQTTQALFGVSQNIFGEIINMKLYLEEDNKCIYRTQLLKATTNGYLKK
jgi:hypothetical protein